MQQDGTGRNDTAASLMLIFGENLRRFRRDDLGISQRGLAAIVGVPQKTVSAVECGTNCTIRLMAKLADGVGVDVPTMLTRR